MRRRLLLLILSAALAVWACGDALGETTVVLTVSEAASIEDVLATVHYGNLFYDRSSLVPSFSDASINRAKDGLPYSVTVGCVNAQVEIFGTIQGTSVRTGSDDLTEIYHGCMARSQLVLTGTVHVLGFADSVTTRETVQGNLTISGPKSGTCALDYGITSTYNRQVSSGPTSIVATGTVCAIDIASFVHLDP